MNTEKLKAAAPQIEHELSQRNLDPLPLEILGEILKALLANDERILVQMMAGMGKSTVIAELIETLFTENLFQKALVVFETKSETDQILDRSGWIGGKINVGHLNEKNQRPISICTKSELRDSLGGLDDFDLIVCDDLRWDEDRDFTSKLRGALDSGAVLIGFAYCGQPIPEDSIFFGVEPAFKMAPSKVMASSNHRMQTFMTALFASLGYHKLFSDDASVLCDTFSHERLDLVARRDDGITVAVEGKYYRTRNVSQELIETVARQARKLFSKIEDHPEQVVIMLCEVPRDYKEKLFKQHGIDTWDIANLLYLCQSNKELTSKLLDLVSFPLNDIEPSPILGEAILPEGFNGDTSATGDDDDDEGRRLIRDLNKCETGTRNGADKNYEKICCDAVKYLFGDEFTQTSGQHKTEDSLFRIDLLCGLKGKTAFWRLLMDHFNTRFVVFEFKNYEDTLRQNLIYVTEKYLFDAALRNVVIIFSRKGFHENATKAAMGSLKENRKLFISVTDADLIAMINWKRDGQEPSDYLLTILEGYLMSISK